MQTAELTTSPSSSVVEPQVRFADRSHYYPLSQLSPRQSSILGWRDDTFVVRCFSNLQSILQTLKSKPSSCCRLLSCTDACMNDTGLVAPTCDELPSPGQQSAIAAVGGGGDGGSDSRVRELVGCPAGRNSVGSACTWRSPSRRRPGLLFTALPKPATLEVQDDTIQHTNSSAVTDPPNQHPILQAGEVAAHRFLICTLSPQHSQA